MTPRYMPCPACEPGEPGWVVVNPDWPRGTLHYRESCPECSGSGQVPYEEYADTTVDGLLELLEALS